MFQQQDHLKSQLQPEGHPANRQLFQCQECGKQYNTQLGYRRHLVAAHGATAGLPRPEGPPSLLEHLGSHGAGNNNNNAALPVRERKYSCERCDRRFYTRKDVRRHAVVHTGRRDFLCPRCAQRFGRRDHLTRHLKKSHAQEAGPAPGGPANPPAVTPTPPSLCPVKEEPSSVACDVGAVPKEPPESSFSMDMYSAYPMASPVPGMGHHHGLMQSSLSSAMGVARHMPPPSPHGHHHHHHLQPPPTPQQQQQAYGSMPRYQHGSTSSYPRADVESFLLDLQSGLPPNHLSAAPSSATSSASSPQREALPEAAPGMTAGAGAGELPNVDLGPLLGFLPFGLPPYSTHMGMGGLMMGYPSTTAANASSAPTSAGLSPQPPGPFALIQPPQAHVPQGPGAHNHSQLPQGYGSPAMSTSTPLPRYYQAFQQ